MEASLNCVTASTTMEFGKKDLHHFEGMSFVKVFQVCVHTDQ